MFELKTKIERVKRGDNWYTVEFVTDTDTGENRILFTHIQDGERLVDYEYTRITKENGNLYYKQLKATAQTDAEGVFYTDKGDNILSILWRKRVEALPFMTALKTVVSGAERRIVI